MRNRCKERGVLELHGKLKLIRKIQGTVKDAKDKADREQRIKEDLKRVRDGG